MKKVTIEQLLSFEKGQVGYFENSNVVDLESIFIYCLNPSKPITQPLTISINEGVSAKK